MRIFLKKNRLWGYVGGTALIPENNAENYAIELDN